MHFARKEQPVQSLPKALTVAQRIEVERRQRYVRKARQLSKGGKGVGGVKVRIKAILLVSEDLKDPNPPSPATIGRWAKKENTLSLGVADEMVGAGRKPHKSKFEYLKPIALDVFHEFFLKESLLEFQATFDIFVGRVKREHGEDSDYPCYATFIGWIKDICSFEASRKRHGKLATSELLRNAVSMIRPSRPLERVEVDGLRLAIGLVDDNKKYLGMVTLILVIDCYTRCILGYCLHVGKGKPASAYIHAYRHALCPKPEGSFNPNCENGWPAYGVWENTVVDGGSGATSLSVNGFLNTAGIPLSVVQTAAGWKKPYVESFNDTVRSNFARLLSSYCGHDLTAVQDHTLQQKASMTPEMFRAAFEKWLLDEYHVSRHSGLNMKSPKDAWKEAQDEGLFAPMLPANYEQVQLPQGETRFAVISGDACHQGVQINNVRYNDADRKLKQIGLKLNRQNQERVVECHYSVVDISEITFRDPFTEQTYVAKATNPDITPGMSLAEYEANRVKRYQNKGFGRKRTFAESEERETTEQAHQTNPDLNRTTKQRRASPEQMAEATNNQMAEYEQQRQTQNNGGGSDTNVTPLPNVDLSSIGGHNHD